MRLGCICIASALYCFGMGSSSFVRSRAVIAVLLINQVYAGDHWVTAIVCSQHGSIAVISYSPPSLLSVFSCIRAYVCISVYISTTIMSIVLYYLIATCHSLKLVEITQLFCVECCVALLCGFIPCLLLPWWLTLTRISEH